MNKYAAIPEELRKLNQWILWKYEDKGSAKPTKVPYSIRATLASVTNEQDWSSFDSCFNVLALGHYDGLGFVFTDKDDYAFIDLDNPQLLSDGKTVNPNKDADLQRQIKIAQEFDSYSEVSPSGQGLHIIVKGKIPQGRRRNFIEIYCSGRYATMTGIVHTPKDIADRNDLLNQLFQQMGGKPNVSNVVNEPETETDDQILKLASQAVNGDKFKLLYEGKWTNFYSSQSEADFALIDIISFYTQNRNQIKRIFRASALGKRDKARRKDYIEWMINKSFDRILPKIDFDGFRIALEEKIQADKDQLVLPLNGSVAQLVEPTVHNSLGAGSSPAASTILPPSGLVGEIAQFIYEAAPRQVPEIAIAGAIGLMAGICGRAYNISGTGLNQYVLLLAATGTGKEAMAIGIDKIINAVQMSVPVAPEFIGPSEIASGQALIKELANKSQSFVSILGEFGLRLRAMSSDRANGAEIALRRMLLDLYNKSGHGQVVRPSIYADKDKNTNLIASPAFSILGESTPDRFYEVLSEEMISEGLLPRFMLIEYYGERPPHNPNAQNAQPSFVLVEKIAQLMANAKTVMANRRVINIEASTEAQKLLHDFDKKADRAINSTDKDILRQLWNRAHMKVLKIAGLIAVGNNYINPVVNVDAVLWAINIVENDIKNLSAKFETGTIGKNTEELKQASEVHRMIKVFITEDWKYISKYCDDERLHSAKIVPYSYLNKRLSNVAAFKNDRLGALNSLKKTINSLVESGFISEPTKKEMVTMFGTTQRAFIISNMNWVLK